jgi:hypothetical protein
MITLATSPRVTREWLETIPCADRARFIEESLSSIESGDAHCLSVKRDGEVVGTVLYRVFGSVFYILALRGKNLSDPCGAITPELEKFAAEKGCAEMMFTTVRPAMVENAVSAGWKCEQIALTKTLKK